MKKFFIALNFALFIFLSFVFIGEASGSFNAYLFYGEGCPHCAKEMAYFNSIKDQYPNLKVTGFEVYYNQENSTLMHQVAMELGVQAGGVPFLVVGDEYFVGFSEKISPGEIENRINYCLQNDCPDIVGKILGLEKSKEVSVVEEKEEGKVVEGLEKNENIIDQNQILGDGGSIKKEKIMQLPIIGSVDVHKFSLPVITIILAFLDGFNPCAMWVLLFLVSLLFGIENKRRLWIFGLVFLTASAFVYFLFMTAWLNLFMFLGFIAIVRVIIGLIALISGYYNLKEYITNPGGGCKITGSEKRRKIFEGLKKIIQQRNLFIAILGLIILAFAVNLVELVCSLGLPAVYTQILSLSNLSSWQYYLYLIFYVIIFILPAFIVFTISATTLHLTGISAKYGRIVHLVSGIIMLIIGVLMIFKPGWLMFG